MNIILNTTVQTVRCADDRFDDILCEEDSVIQVVNAFYGDIGHKTECTLTNICNYGCRVAVDVTDQYYNNILEHCSGQTSCNSLPAFPGSHTACSDGSWNTQTDYVMIVYRCVSSKFSYQ